VLVLLMGRIYDVRRLNYLGWQGIYDYTKFHEDCFSHSSNIGVITSEI
jgi:hypothetical protein